MSVFVAVGEGGKIVGTIACSVVTADEGHLRGNGGSAGMAGRGHRRRDYCSRPKTNSAHEVFANHAGHNRATLARQGILRKARLSALPARSRDFFGMPLHEYVKYLRS